MGIRKKLILAVSTIVFLFSLVCLGKFVEVVSPGNVVVLQDPFDGELHVWTTAGPKWQGFGDITIYKKSVQYWFTEDNNGSIRMRFNDGGHADMFGSFRWDMPRSDNYVLQLHQLFGSQTAIEQELIRPTIERAVYMTGPLMSSAESYSERRPDLINYITDQATYGVFRTVTTDTTINDPLTGVEKSATVVTIVNDSTAPNGYGRQEDSPVARFQIPISNLAINEILYNEQIEGQIEVQRRAKMDVETAIAEARKAEQDAIKAEKEGQAAAARAQWEQEVIKAKMVTEAQQRLEVAELDRQSAEQRRQEQILLGQGEAERKRLVMQADGALEVKGQLWLEAQKVWANAYATSNHRPTPEIVFGGTSGTNGVDAVQQLATMTMMETARNLQLDIQPER